MSSRRNSSGASSHKAAAAASKSTAVKKTTTRSPTRSASKKNATASSPSTPSKRARVPAAASSESMEDEPTPDATAQVTNSNSSPAKGSSVSRNLFAASTEATATNTNSNKNSKRRRLKKYTDSTANSSSAAAAASEVPMHDVSDPYQDPCDTEGHPIVSAPTEATAVDDDDDDDYKHNGDDATNDINDNARSAFDAHGNTAKDRLRVAVAKEANRASALASKRANRRSDRALAQQKAEQEAMEEAEQIEAAKQLSESDAKIKQGAITIVDSSDSDDNDNEDDEEDEDEEEEEAKTASNPFIDDAAVENNVPSEEDEDEELDNNDQQQDDDADNSDSDSDAEMLVPAKRRNAKAKAPTQAASSTSESGSGDSDSGSESDAPAPVIPTSAPSTPTKVAVGAPVSPLKSPVKAWKPAVVSSGAYASNGGSKSKTYEVVVVSRGDLGHATNKAGLVPRIFVYVRDLAKNKDMLVVGYGADATNYLGNLVPHSCYKMQLDAQEVPESKQTCIHSNVTYKLAPGGKINEYAPKDAAEVEAAKVTVASILKPISAIAQANEGDLVNFSGIIMEVLPPVNSSRFNSGVKVVIADDTHFVSVMFFDSKNLSIGDPVIVIGGKLWLSRFKTKEVSIMSSLALVSSGAMADATLTLSDKTRRNCKHQNHKKPNKMINVSGVPTKEVRSLVDVKAEAAGLQSHMATVEATVMLHLDNPVSKVPMTYNGCDQCMKKMEQLDRVDANNNALYAHAKDGGHVSTSYTTHYYFPARFKSPNDDILVYTAQVDDALGLILFGVTADQMASMEPEELTQLLATRTEIVWKMNVTVLKNGDIASIVIV